MSYSQLKIQTFIKTLNVSLFITMFIFCTRDNFVHSSCNTCSGQFATSNSNRLIDYALDGFIAQSILVSDHAECFTRCIEDNCTCLSYNYKTTPEINGKYLCELNYQDKESKPEALIQRKDWKYYDIVSEGSNGSCSNTDCPNSCCEPNPCHNNGECLPLCGSIRRFQCACESTRYMGRLCEMALRTCADHLKKNISSVSGIYTIDLEDNANTRVFCDMDSQTRIAWTLVNSYFYVNNSVFKHKAFHKDLPINEATPNFSGYRLSLAKMQELKNYSSLWKASCNYEKPRVDMKRDSMDGSFAVTDVLYETKSDFCSIVNFVNIRGYECSNCTVVLRRNKYTAIHVGVGSTVGRCSFKPAKKSGGEQIFGNYYQINGDSTCSNHPNSTTQWWFGRKI